ncbi:MAG TPA: nitrilase-related carbon-nitrogen hydrolase [Fimbriimonadaceae bacterium]|nr:nitrilase-related carbon-nitrogen hydrolase [Fimbriimonadaceae bacterium]
MTFTVACAQFAPRKADVSQNLDRIAEITRQASDAGADLVTFPESATSAYFLEGGVLESALTAEALHAQLAARLTSIERPVDVMLGFYELEVGNLFNSAAYFEFQPDRSELVHVYRKFFLPTYGVFDEERFVSRGHELGVFRSRLGRFGILICEDVWHSILPTLCAVYGAEVLLIPSASPARGFRDGVPENLKRYERMLRGIVEEHGVYAVNTHLVGFEGGKGFVGGSLVLDPHGHVLGQAPIGEDHLLLVEIDTDVVSIARAQTPLLSDLQSAWTDICRLAARGR